MGRSYIYRIPHTAPPGRESESAARGLGCISYLHNQPRTSCICHCRTHTAGTQLNSRWIHDGCRCLFCVFRGWDLHGCVRKSSAKHSPLTLVSLFSTTDQYNYLGDSPESYGVDWATLAYEGLTIAMAGYGTQNPKPTKSALVQGATKRAHMQKNASQLVPPLLVCGCKTTQAIFTANYEVCDGAMEYDGGSKPWSADFNFRVPKNATAGVS